MKPDFIIVSGNRFVALNGASGSIENFGFDSVAFQETARMETERDGDGFKCRITYEQPAPRVVLDKTEENQK